MQLLLVKARLKYVHVHKTATLTGTHIRTWHSQSYVLTLFTNFYFLEVLVLRPLTTLKLLL